MTSSSNTFPDDGRVPGGLLRSFPELGDRGIRWAMVGVFLVLLVSRGPALILPGFSIDDWGYFQHPPNFASLKQLVIAQGRPLQAVQFELMHRLGLQGPGISPLVVVLGIATMMVVALTLVRLWRLRGHPVAAFFALVWVTNHPYQIEFWTFRTAMASLPVTALVFLAQYWLRPGIFSILVAAAMTTVALLVYQVPLTWMATALMVQVLLQLLTPGELEWRALGRYFKFELLPRVAVLGISVVMYFLIAFAFRRYFGIESDARATLLPMAQLGQRVGQAQSLFHDVLLGTETLVPHLVKMLLIAAAVGAAWAGLRLMLRDRGFRGVLLWLGASVVVVGLGLLSIPGPSLVLSDWWPAPRVLASTGFFWGGVLAVGLVLHVGLPRKVLITIATVVTVSFLGVTHRVFYEQYLGNARDRLIATRIVARLEALPEFGSARTLAVVGGCWRFPHVYSTSVRDMNVSGLFQSWSRGHVFYQVLGHRLAAPSAAQQAAAERYRAEHAPWPHADSVTIVEDLAIICLPDR